MPISAKIILDSVAPNGARLTTVEGHFPRIILAEVNTYRVMSRNTSSSRAIPASKMRARVKDETFIPVHFGANQKGMRADNEVEDITKAREWWLKCANMALQLHEEGEALGIHKQIVNRVIEPYMYTTQVMSGTDWGNLFFQRRHKDAQPEFKEFANLLWEAMRNSKPTFINFPGWHLPYVTNEDRKQTNNNISLLKKISVGRCARTSYLSHDGKRDIQADIDLHDKLLLGRFTSEPVSYTHLRAHET